MHLFNLKSPKCVCVNYDLLLLPAQLYGSTDSLHSSHPFTHPLLLHLLKRQDVFVFPLVSKMSLFVSHHLQLEGENRNLFFF